MRTAALLLAAALGAAGLAAVEPLEVTATAPWSDPDGYSPVVLRATARVDVSVRLVAEKGRTSATTDLTLSAGDSVERTLLLPPSADGMNHIRLRWSTSDGAEGEVSTRATIDPDTADVVAVDPRETVPLADLARAMESRVSVTGRTRWSGASSYTSTRMVRVPPDSLPDRWQAWPSWLTLVVAPEAEALLRDEQRQAIADWVRSGGALYVAGAAQAARWRAVGVEPKALALTRAANGSVDVGAGGVPDLTARLQQVMEDRQFVPPQHRVPGTERVPVTGFVLVAGLFALLVGPVNLWWVRRRDARHLFLVTTPLLSLATCVGLVVFNLISEGVSLRRSAMQFAILDQGAQRVATWTSATYFAGFAVSAIVLDNDAKVVPLDPEDQHDPWRYRRTARRDASALALEWRDGQVATGGWIPARVNRHLAYCELRPERRRLIVSRAGAGWAATNGLDAPLTDLRWRDAEGGWWGRASLAAGERAELTPAAPPAELTVPDDVAAYRPGVERTIAVADLARERVGVAAKRAWDAAMARPHVATAVLGAPITPTPGPRSEDAAAIETHLLALAEPE